MEDVRSVTLYPSLSGDPNMVCIKMSDPAIKIRTRTHPSFTRSYISDEALATLSRTNQASSKFKPNFGVTSQRYASVSLVPGKLPGPRPRPHPHIRGSSSKSLIFMEPDPNLRYVPSPTPVDSGLPPPMTDEQIKAKAAYVRAHLAAATAEIEATSARALAAAPRIPCYWEDPSKKKASEAAATSTEGQAEAGGPVPKSACEDQKPCATDLIRSTSTMSI